MKNNIHFPVKVEELEETIKNKFEHQSVDDLTFSIYLHQDKKIAVFSINYLVDTDRLVSALLAPLLEHETAWSTTELTNKLPIEDYSTTNNFEEILEHLITGSVLIYVEGENEVVSYPLIHKEERDLDKSETESVIIGLQLSFTESLDTNLNIIRQVLTSTDLVIEKYMVGSVVPREVRILYMKSVANETDINTMRQRIKEVDVDEIEDSTALKQYIEDSTLSLFPQFGLTELPALLSYTIKEGKIGVLVENSPNAFIAPSTFFSFFQTTEDTYMRWAQASAFRLLRIVAVILAILLTPLYVAITTFHYELLPTELMISIGESRSTVPFPPIIEALLIELMIELLREAGARLPTKIGGTMGIVGGIVIGEAAAQAGFTSSVLIIVVAASALASFTTPNYLMGTSLRVIRFPLILLAGLYGLIGVMFSVCFLIIQLLRTKSLGRSYLSPLYPLRLQDFNKVFFHLPPRKKGDRATMYRPRDQERFSKKDASKVRDIEK